MTDHSSHTDEALAELFRQGDDAAFREIYQRYDKPLFLFAANRLQDDDEAMDVVQDVFVWILANREKIALRTALSSYLYKAVLNKIFDIFKRQKTIRKYIDQGEHFIEVDSRETDFLIREKEVRAMIDAEIATMPPRMREIYELRHKQQLSPKEIAEKLDISESTVNVQLQRGTKHLKDKLGIIIVVLYVLGR